MIKNLQLKKNYLGLFAHKILIQKNVIYFSSIDPYYILGVERNVDFNEIKKAFYKLANEFHPDKNKSPGAEKQFILIKEAFEQIKLSKGKSIKMDYEGSSMKKSDFHSVRPNSADYKEDFSKESPEQDHKKYKEYAETSPDSPEFQDLKESLNTIHTLRDIKLRSDDVQMPDPSKRFGMEEKRMRLKNFSDGSYLFLGVIIIFFGLGFYFMNTTHNNMVVKKYQGLIYNMLNRQDFEEEIKKDPDILEDVAFSFKQKKEYTQFINQFEQKKKESEILRQQKSPVLQSFVTSSDINEYADN